MPKEVHDLVDKLLRKKDFYPDKSDEERESIAWGIAQIQKGHGKKEKKSSVGDALVACANALDEMGLHKEADVVTGVMLRLAKVKI